MRNHQHRILRKTTSPRPKKTYVNFFDSEEYKELERKHQEGSLTIDEYREAIKLIVEKLQV